MYNISFFYKEIFTIDFSFFKNEISISDLVWSISMLNLGLKPSKPIKTILTNVIKFGRTLLSRTPRNIRRWSSLPTWRILKKV
jgi:hypothetical protein